MAPLPLTEFARVESDRDGRVRAPGIGWARWGGSITKLCNESEVKPTRALAIAAALALVLSCIPTNPGDKPGWGLFPGSTGVNGTGSTPGVLVLGDSLVWGANVQTLADMIRFWRGTS